MSGISQFASIMKTGFARPNLFRVRINGSRKSPTKPDGLRGFQHSCFQAQIPGNNILTTDKDIGFRSVAYQKAYSDIILGFYVGGDLRELNYWQEWIEDILPTSEGKEHGQGFHFNYYDDYIGTINITQLSRGQIPIRTWTLHDAYPKQVDPIQLDYGTNDAVMTCSVTITYRYFQITQPTLTNASEVKQKKVTPDYTESVQVEKNKDRYEDIHGSDDAWKFGNNIINKPDFMKAYPNWDTMDQSERQRAYKTYGVDRHGFSPSGGARNMIETDQEEF